MTKLLQYICLAVFVCFTLCLSSSYAQNDFSAVIDNSTFMTKMKEISQATETIQCAFVQEKQLSFMDQKMVSEGNLYFSGTDKLRWEYVEPYNYAVLMVSDKLTIIDEGNVNETKLGKNPAFKKVQQLLTASLKGDFESQTSTFNQVLDQNDEYYRMTLTPKDDSMKDFVSTMQVYFLKENLMLSRFVMDESGDITNTVFSNQKINADLPQDIFNW